ncbi:unnamed protein product [Pedinophyceae sp. YPF-701]|nr:unnamed protein product [Pedinophyceae sp. YPF-701]
MVQCLCQPPVRPSVPGARLQPRHGARSVCQLRARAGAFAQRAPFARTRRWQTCDPRGLVCVRAEDEDAADPEALARVEQELRGTCAFVVDKFISDGMVVAFGDGMLSAFAMEYLAGKIEAKELKDVQAVPATASAAAEAALHGLRLAMPGDFEKYDLFIQEVDEVDRHNLAVIVGRSSQPRQPELMKHRLAALKADKMIALVQARRLRPTATCARREHAPRTLKYVFT